MHEEKGEGWQAPQQQQLCYNEEEALKLQSTDDKSWGPSHVDAFGVCWGVLGHSSYLSNNKTDETVISNVNIVQMHSSNYSADAGLTGIQADPSKAVGFSPLCNEEYVMSQQCCRLAISWRKRSIQSRLKFSTNMFLLLDNQSWYPYKRLFFRYFILKNQK